MIKQISWAGYFTAIGITLICYYIIVCFKYYSFEIKQILLDKFKLSFKKRTLSASLRTTGNQNLFEATEAHPDLFPLVNQLAQEVKMMLEEAARKNLAKQEIIYALQVRLKKYTTIKGTPFESIINSYIHTECVNYCSIHLEKEEVNNVWVE